MTWKKLTGTIKGEFSQAEVEMLPDNEGWVCRFSKKKMDDGGVVEEFGPGKLEKAHDWCIKQISDYEKSTKN